MPPYVPPTPPGGIVSMIVARPMTAASGMPAAHRLRQRHQVRLDPERARRRTSSPVRPKPLCTSSLIKTMPCRSRTRAAPEGTPRRHHEAAFAEHRLDDDRGQFRAARRSSCSACSIEPRSTIPGRDSVIRERQPVDLRRNGPKPGLVRRRLAGQRSVPAASGRGSHARSRGPRCAWWSRARS